MSDPPILAGILIAAGSWSLIRWVLGARASAATAAERAAGTPLLQPAAARTAALEQQARMGLEQIRQHLAPVQTPVSAVRPQPARPAAQEARAEDPLPVFVIREGTPPARPSASPSPAPPPPQPYRAPPAPRPSPSAASWISPGQHVTIAGITITTGMIHVGEHLPGPHGWGMEPSLIRPSLAVAARLDPATDGWCNDYGDTSPEMRRRYLEWLAGGRQDGSVPVSLVLLFMQGLERRLFLDKAMHEAASLADEVLRLRDLYGGRDDTLHGAATDFLAAASLLAGGGVPRMLPAPPRGYQPEMPLATLLHLAAALAEERPLTADDALIWTLGMPGASLRTPGRRCFAELCQLFAIRFSEQHPTGLATRRPRRDLAPVYRGSRGQLEVPLPLPPGKWHDISVLQAPLPGLAAMLDQCQTELDGFSRLVGRRPEARAHLDGALLLPEPLRKIALVQETRLTLEALAPFWVTEGFWLLRAGALLHMWRLATPAAGGRLPAGILTSMQQRLDALGFGVEPDRRRGGTPLATETELALFRLPEGAASAPATPAYEAARLTLGIAAMAASADGQLTEDEFAALLRSARAAPGLASGEQQRLEAYLWTLRHHAGKGVTMARLGELPAATRQFVARSAVSAVLADGHASVAEITFLEKLHAALGLPASMLHSALHQGDMAPEAETPSPAGFTLDTGRLARLREETAQASSLLAGIFTDEAEETPSPPPSSPKATTEAPPRFAGLDEAHAGLLAVVAEAGSLTAAAFAEHAKALKLLPDGALETINDWAFDQYDEPLLEEDGKTIFIPRHMLENL